MIAKCHQEAARCVETSECCRKAHPPHKYCRRCHGHALWPGEGARDHTHATDLKTKLALGIEDQHPEIQCIGYDDISAAGRDDLGWGMKSPAAGGFRVKGALEVAPWKYRI